MQKHENLYVFIEQTLKIILENGKQCHSPIFYYSCFTWTIIYVNM